MKRWLTATAASLAALLMAVLGSPAVAGPSVTVKERVTEKNCVVTVVGSYGGAYWIPQGGTWDMTIHINSTYGTGNQVSFPILKKSGRATATFVGTTRATENETLVMTEIAGSSVTASYTFYPFCENWTVAPS